MNAAHYNIAPVEAVVKDLYRLVNDVNPDNGWQFIQYAMNNSGQLMDAFSITQGLSPDALLSLATNHAGKLDSIMQHLPAPVMNMLFNPLIEQFQTLAQTAGQLPGM